MVLSKTFSYSTFILKIFIKYTGVILPYAVPLHKKNFRKKTENKEVLFDEKIKLNDNTFHAFKSKETFSLF